MPSRRRILRLAAIGMLAIAAAARAQTPAPERFDIAITVDDLPAHGELPPGMTRLGIAQSYLATLKAHGVPEAFGFVNASKLDKEAGAGAVLAAWRQAGYPLGNHTNTHLNLERAPSFEAWQADVIAGEAAVAAAMGPNDWHWLRMPNLSMGARREQALALMRERGYRLADVSVAFGDWVYTDAYARCLAKGDQAAIAAMKRQYLRKVDAGILDMKAQSRQVFGRVIPQVLLTHLGGWSAVTMPEVMARLDAAGAHYVTLAQAESDPAYGLTGGGSLIARAAKAKGIKLASVAARDEPELDVKALCR
jgi:peptidoglycan/xylan/chitin deacetylase (PgdA/CDA1 family)